MSSEDSRVFGEATLAPFADAAVPLVGDRPTAVVLVKGDSERLSDTIAEYAEASRAELVVCGSHHLCVKGARGAAQLPCTRYYPVLMSLA